MSIKVSLEVEASSWLTETGIETTVYIGDVDMPQVVKVESLESLIAKTLLSYEVEFRIASEHKEDVERLLTTLNTACEYAEERVREMGFDE